MEIWRSSDKNKNAQFFLDTVYISGPWPFEFMHNLYMADLYRPGAIFFAAESVGLSLASSGKAI